jgi:hypothetical protein
VSPPAAPAERAPRSCCGSPAACGSHATFTIPRLHEAGSGPGRSSVRIQVPGRGAPEPRTLRPDEAKGIPRCPAFAVPHTVERGRGASLAPQCTDRRETEFTRGTHRRALHPVSWPIQRGILRRGAYPVSIPRAGRCGGESPSRRTKHPARNAIHYTQREKCRQGLPPSHDTPRPASPATGQSQRIPAARADAASRFDCRCELVFFAKTAGRSAVVLWFRGNWTKECCEWRLTSVDVQAVRRQAYGGRRMSAAVPLCSAVTPSQGEAHREDPGGSLPCPARSRPSPQCVSRPSHQSFRRAPEPGPAHTRSRLFGPVPSRGAGCAWRTPIVSLARTAPCSRGLSRTRSGVRGFWLRRGEGGILRGPQRFGGCRAQGDADGDPRCASPWLGVTAVRGWSDCCARETGDRSAERPIPTIPRGLSAQRHVMRRVRKKWRMRRKTPLLFSASSAPSA